MAAGASVSKTSVRATRKQFETRPDQEPTACRIKADSAATIDNEDGDFDDPELEVKTRTIIVMPEDLLAGFEEDKFDEDQDDMMGIHAVRNTISLILLIISRRNTKFQDLCQCWLNLSLCILYFSFVWHVQLKVSSISAWNELYCLVRFRFRKGNDSNSGRSAATHS
ncbi:hypothetical protein F5Y18DRAFT_422815 [Xylariaceae sp. FL1019]|nr:hypothetical protein F5Y18DRAFT_422815 [Xylariaceae sp. FL1019]